MLTEDEELERWNEALKANNNIEEDNRIEKEGRGENKRGEK